MPPSGLPEHFHNEFTFNGSSKQEQACNNQRNLRPRRNEAKTLPFTSELKPNRKHAKEGSCKSQTQAPTLPSTPRKRRRTSPSSTTYNPTIYPHVTDHLTPTCSSPHPTALDILICGLNPGLRSSQRGLHFAHPSNHFYRTLHLGRLTPCIIKPDSCAELVNQTWPFPSLGLTNICCRPTREGSQLNREDFKMGTPVLNAKIVTVARPRVTVFTGKGIAAEWERCARDVGAIGYDGNRTKKKGRIKTEQGQDQSTKSKVKTELHHGDDDDKVQTTPHIKSESTNMFPAPIKREEQEKDTASKRVHPHSTITLSFPASIPFATTNKQGLGLMPYVFDLNNDSPSDSHNRYSFLFLVTSPSGRVTTMHLPEKGMWMGRARDLWEFLIGKGDHGHEQTLVERTFELVRLTEIKSEDGA